MIVVGAYARIDPQQPRATRQRLDALEGVETFDLDDLYRVGLLIEADSLDAAHLLIDQVIPAVEGVLGVWPIFVGDETGNWDADKTSRTCTPPAETMDHISGVQGV